MFRLKSIKNMLKSEGFSIQDLVDEILDLADSTVYKYVRGEGNPTLSALNIIAEGLSRLLNRPIDIGDLVENTNNEIHNDILEIEKNDNLQIIKAVTDLIRNNFESDNVISRSLELEKIKKNKIPWSLERINWFQLIATSILAIAGIFGGIFLQNYYGFLESSLPPVPKLLFPSREVITENIELVVEKTRNAKGYDFYLKNADNNLVLIEIDDYENHKSTKLLVPPFLCRGGKYSWTARARNQGNTSSWASAMAFTYNPPSEIKEIPNSNEFPNLPKQPIPLEPQNTINRTNITLRVGKSSDAMIYGFYMRDLTTDELVVYAPYESKPEFIVDPKLIIDGHSYRWNANAINCVGYSKISNLAFFDVELP